MNNYPKFDDLEDKNKHVQTEHLDNNSVCLTQVRN
jgi:hypothetical protein